MGYDIKNQVGGVRRTSGVSFPRLPTTPTPTGEPQGRRENLVDRRKIFGKATSPTWRRDGGSTLGRVRSGSRRLPPWPVRNCASQASLFPITNEAGIKAGIAQKQRDGGSAPGTVLADPLIPPAPADYHPPAPPRQKVSWSCLLAYASGSLHLAWAACEVPAALGSAASSYF